MYQQLVAYEADHGDTGILQHYNKDQKHRIWVNTQRFRYRNNKTQEECRKYLLDSIDFMLDAKESRTWTLGLQSTYYFQEQNDDRESQTYLELNLVLLWSDNNVRWSGKLRRLVAYKVEHNGSCLVPNCYNEYSQLGCWIDRQQLEIRKNKLTEDRVTLLKATDFVWGVKEEICNANVETRKLLRAWS